MAVQDYLSSSYNHTTTIAISIFLFLSMLLAFVMSVLQWKSDDYDLHDPYNHPDYLTFKNPGTEACAVEVVCLVYSFAFVILQTQLPRFPSATTSAVYQIVLLFSAGFTLVWAFGFIAALIAYWSQSLLPYALYRMKNAQPEEPNARPAGPLAQLAPQEQVELLEEMATLKRRLEAAEAEKRLSSSSWNLDAGTTTHFPVEDDQSTFIGAPVRGRRVEFQLGPTPPPRRRSPAAYRLFSRPPARMAA
ncbi:hypothetical protein M3Y99_00836400 [Aphelenchoides fujianensis]|nr:hypothetical protein M3Y99_00836400 [Aphelenchoides fujianensis]